MVRLPKLLNIEASEGSKPGSSHLMARLLNIEATEGSKLGSPRLMARLPELLHACGRTTNPYWQVLYMLASWRYNGLLATSQRSSAPDLQADGMC